MQYQCVPEEKGILQCLLCSEGTILHHAEVSQNCTFHHVPVAQAALGIKINKLK
jgi:hypothetical protein